MGDDYEQIFSYTRHNRLPQVKQLLDEDGVDPEVRDWAGNTILIISCQNGLKNMLKCVLRRGGSMDTQNVSSNGVPFKKSSLTRNIIVRRIKETQVCTLHTLMATEILSESTSSQKEPMIPSRITLD
jgi:ankyrin repeat protein